MVERVVKATVSGWRPWAIGAALSVVGAAVLFVRWQRNALDTYEAWWERRDQVRTNGHQPARAESDRDGQPQLFV